MKNFIGQNRLITKINNFTLNTLPKTILFLGPQGCGKKELAKYIAKRFSLDYTEILSTEAADDIQQYNYRTINTLYCIDLDCFTNKQQNMFLKFIEEPSNTVFIVLIAQSELNILSTILNRCTRYTFEQYSKAEVQQIINKSISDYMYTVLKTPGKLLNTTETAFSETVDLANNFISHCAQVSYANILTIVDRINYKDTYNKVDFSLFFDVLEQIAFENFMKTNNYNSLIIYNVTNAYKKRTFNKMLLKEPLMLSFLTTLQETLKNEAN